jgi:menaquinone-9 beta-reductase
VQYTRILIIGGGPAGATTSLFLAKYGIAHTLVDAQIFPRDKICGDGLDLKVARVLNALDPSIMEESFPSDSHFLPIKGLKFSSPNGRSSLFEYQPSIERPHAHLFWTSKRLHFDHFLLQRTDPKQTDLRQGCEVTKITREGALWRIQLLQDGVESQLTTDFIIAADGDHSIMLRTLGQREVHKTHYAATLRQYWRNIGGMEQQSAIEVYLPPKLPMSYFYIFPLPNGEANVGYGMTSSVVAAKKHNLRNIFQGLIKDDPILRDRFKDAEPLEKPCGWGLPLASLKRKTYGDGYIIIGDAASMIGPTNGEGIGTGMMSGLIAAHFVKEGIERNDLSINHFRNFDREMYRRLQSEIKSYRLTMQVKPWFIWDAAFNVGPHMPFLKTRFKQNVEKWIHTAYEAPIEIHVD